MRQEGERYQGKRDKTSEEQDRKGRNEGNGAKDYEQEQEARQLRRNYQKRTSIRHSMMREDSKTQTK